MFGKIPVDQIESISDEELRTLEASALGYWDREHVRSEIGRRTDARCRRGREIGDVIEFVRYGKPVETSRNHRDGITEPGMSVYLLDGDEIVFVGWWFGIVERPAYRGRGRIVEWGSDGEPVVEVLGKCRRAKQFDQKD